jgi:hypothetical protein
MKKVFLLALLLGACARLYAATGISSWLLIDGYPEASARGGSGGVSGYGIQYAGINPAALAGVENFSFEAMHAVFPADISLEKVTAGKYYDFGVLGLDLGYFDFGQISNIGIDTSLSPVISGSTTMPYALNAALIYAKKMDNFSVGLSARGACEYTGGATLVYAMADAGAIADDIFTEGLSFGASLTNISGDQGGFSAPMDAAAGFSYSIKNKLRELMKISISGDYIPVMDQLKGSAGFDFPVTDDFIIRGGVGAPWNGQVKFSGGLTLKAMGIAFNYAYLPDTNIGDVHKISIGAAFGREEERSAEKPATKETETFGGYMKSGDYYYDNRQYGMALKYYEYINLIYWKELEALPDIEKSAFNQKLGICYYNIRDNRHALQYFERAFYYDKLNEILKHWIRLLK